MAIGTYVQFFTPKILDGSDSKFSLLHDSSCAPMVILCADFKMSNMVMDLIDNSCHHCICMEIECHVIMLFLLPTMQSCS